MRSVSRRNILNTYQRYITKYPVNWLPTFFFGNITLFSNSQELKTHSLVQNNYSGSRFRNNFNIQIILCWRPRIYQIKQGPSKDKAVLILKHNAPKKKNIYLLPTKPKTPNEPLKFFTKLQVNRRKNNVYKFYIKNIWNLVAVTLMWFWV